MRSRVKSAKTVKVIPLESIPPGHYSGLWGGYLVQMLIADNYYIELNTEDGVRGIDIPCTIEVADNGEITVRVEK